jgi:hypothetical protein
MLLGHDVVADREPEASPVGLVVKNGWNSLSHKVTGIRSESTRIAY